MNTNHKNRILPVGIINPVIILGLKSCTENISRLKSCAGNRLNENYFPKTNVYLQNP